MEESRLKPMVENYDVKLFEQIYRDTDKLRKKLAWQIDARRLGYDTSEVLSWFSVKFIHAFNRYYGKMEPDLLKAHIIKSLEFFKQRILRFAYSNKATIYNTVEVDDIHGLCSDIPTELDRDRDNSTLLQLSIAHLKSQLTPDAFRVLCTEIHTPLYIIKQMAEKGKSSTAQIPSKFVAEYLGWNDKNALKRVIKAREEIRNAVGVAREYFSCKDI